MAKRSNATPGKHLLDIARKERSIIIEQLAMLKGDHVALLLSGGIDSIALACGLHELGIKTTVYSITRSDYESRDFVAAKRNAKMLGFDFVPVLMPTDPGSVLHGVLQAIGYGARKKSKIECAWPLFLAYKQISEDGFSKVVSGEFADKLYCNTRAFCMSGGAKDPGACDRYRASTIGDEQSNAEKDYAKDHGVEIVYPYMDKRLVSVYKGMTYKDLNGTVQKWPRKLAWKAYIDKGLSVHSPSNMQCGDTRIRELYEQLLRTIVNYKGHNSVRGLYRQLAEQCPDGELRGELHALIVAKGLDMEEKQKPNNKKPANHNGNKRSEKRTAEPRYTRVNTCKECTVKCTVGTCKMAKVPEMRDYGGIRHTADGFDCALPVTIDSHSHCSFGCLYCFSDNLWGHAHGADASGQTKATVGEMDLRKLDAIFSGGGGEDGRLIRKALRYDKRNELGYPCPVQLGGLNDPMDNIERQQGWFLEFCKLIEKHQQPVRVSTKGDMLLVPEYQKAIAPVAHLFWFAFSIITCDDELLEKIDVGAPNATQRLKAMKAATDLGCSASLRFRPMFPRVSDSTPRHPNALKELIDRAALAGAKAVSAEVAFFPGSGLGTGVQAAKWKRLLEVTGLPIEQIYRSFGKVTACTRPSAMWTENVMHAVAEHTHANGMALGISDPVWKQLTDTGCCCGIMPDDPVFGNWEVENATEALLRAKNDPSFIIKPEHIIPPWAHEMLASKMCMLGTGPKTVYGKRHVTWADKLLKNYYDTSSDRGPYGYFQGALEPVDLGDGTMGYKYVGLKRKHPKNVPYWNV